MTIRTAAASDLGSVRDNNEDRVLVVTPKDPSLGTLLCVADGMGGHPAGEEASQAVIDVLSAWESHAVEEAVAGDPSFDSLSQILVSLVEQAHARIREIGEADPAKYSLGTTVVAAVVRGDRAHVVHCGDSRAYQLRGDVLEQLTVDHVVVDGGVRFLAAHVGMPEGLRVDRRDVELKPGDRLLLCSDGLTDMLPPDLFGGLLFEAEAPDEAVTNLIRSAKAAGGFDNVTCAVAWIDEIA